MSSSATLKAVATGQFAAQANEMSPTLRDLLQGSFNPDSWHVMQERDNALIRDEVMHGSVSKAFVYEFEMSGKKVTGVSVVGARELASQYKGIKSRIVATVEKRGSLFIFRTFTPLSIDTRTLHELEGDDDFYECVMEVSDIKTGNSIEVRKKETKFERKRDGTMFGRPHYDVIAESKAFRNGVLSVLPQSVIGDFKNRCLAAGNSQKEQTIDQRRASAQTYAAKHGIALNRQAMQELSFAELDGLGAAAAQGTEAFRLSAQALGLVGTNAAAPGAPAGPADTPAAPAPDKRPPAKSAAAKKAESAPAPAGVEAESAAAAPAAAPAGKTYAQWVDLIQTAAEAESAALFLDEARGSLNEQMHTELSAVYRKKWGQ